MGFAMADYVKNIIRRWPRPGPKEAPERGTVEVVVTLTVEASGYEM